MDQYFNLQTSETSLRQEQLSKQAAMGDASVDSYLQRLGVSDETISFVNTLTDAKLKQQVIGYLRKFPQTNKETLLSEVALQSKHPQQQANTPQEIALANRFQNTEFQRWLLVTLRKARNEFNLAKKLENETFTGDGYSFNNLGRLNFDTVSDISQGIFDWYVRGVLPARQAFQTARTPEEQAAVANEYGVTNANTNLAGLTFDQAFEFAENWHKVIAGEGEGLEYYGEKREEIVYGPTWKEAQYNGWTIKQVRTKNNLRTEGTKMGHCVGSYCNDVMRGKTRIFSLRDASNTPHVTMEVHPKLWEFNQIRGNGPKTGNATPSKKLKAMIGEWMQTLQSVKIVGADNFEYEKCDYRDLDETLEQSIYKSNDSNDYGLPVDLSSWDFDQAYTYVYENLQDRGRGAYDNDGGYQTKYVAKTLARAAVDADMQAIQRDRINEKDIKATAMVIVRRARKHRMISKNQFDRMSIENRKEYVKDYIKQGEKSFELRQSEAIMHRTQNWQNYLDPRNREKTVLEHAYYYMSDVPEFDTEKIKKFDDLNKNDQKRFLSMALDKYFQITQAFDKRQKNDEDFFATWDESHLDIPVAPEQEDYETNEEFKQAYADWEEEEQKIRDEAVTDHQKNNVPYCLDDAIIANIEEILMQKSFALPKWIRKYFKRADERLHYPMILWVLESVAKKKKSATKSKKQTKAFGWYGLCKIKDYSL